MFVENITKTNYTRQRYLPACWTKIAFTRAVQTVNHQKSSENCRKLITRPAIAERRRDKKKAFCIRNVARVNCIKCIEKKNT